MPSKRPEGSAEAFSVYLNPRLPVIQAFKDKNSSVEVNAEKSLVKLGEQSVGPLIHALYDEESSVRDIAAETLGDLKDIQAVEPLIYTLEDDSFFVI